MSTAPLQWPQGFDVVYQRGLRAYQNGRTTPSTMFGNEEIEFLRSIGCSTQELFDYFEDFVNSGEPSFDDAIAVASIRREYFLNIQKGVLSTKVVPMSELPPKSEAIAGLTWLPRIIAKARIKLRGEMPPDLMYGCGGDRPFLKSVNMTLPGFLKLVWDRGQDTGAIIKEVVQSARGAK